MNNGGFYYNLLPDDVKNEWLLEMNRLRLYSDSNHYLNSNFETFYDFMISSFNFSKTRSGAKYWYDISISYDKFKISYERDQKLKELGI